MTTIKFPKFKNDSHDFLWIDKLYIYSRSARMEIKETFRPVALFRTGTEKEIPSLIAPRESSVMLNPGYCAVGKKGGFGSRKGNKTDRNP